MRTLTPIHRHGLKPRPAGFEPVPKLPQSPAATAFSHPDDPSAFKVGDQGDELPGPAKVEFNDADLFALAIPDSPVVLFQPPFDDLLNPNAEVGAKPRG